MKLLNTILYKVIQSKSLFKPPKRYFFADDEQNDGFIIQKRFDDSFNDENSADEDESEDEDEDFGIFLEFV